MLLPTFAFQKSNGGSVTRFTDPVTETKSNGVSNGALLFALLFVYGYGHHGPRGTTALTTCEDRGQGGVATVSDDWLCPHLFTFVLLKFLFM